MRAKFLFIVTAGRSGSTLLQGILNSIPGYCIAGERAAFTAPLFDCYQRLLRSYRVDGDTTTPIHPYYGAQEIDLDGFFTDARTLIIRQLAKDPSLYSCLGFKEIGWLARDIIGTNLLAYLRFLQNVFPGARIIFLTRDINEIATSGWWKDYDFNDVHDHITSFYAVMRAFSNTESVFEIDYSHLTSESQRLRDLYDFLGETIDWNSVSKVLAQTHSGRTLRAARPALAG